MNDIDDPFLDYEGASELLGQLGVEISARSIAENAGKKLMPFFTIPGRRGKVIRKSALLRWLIDSQNKAVRQIEQENGRRIRA